MNFAIAMHNAGANRISSARHSTYGCIMAAIVEARGISKTFRQHRRFPGFAGALRTLFTREYTEVAAVNDVNFRHRRGRGTPALCDWALSGRQRIRA